MDMIMEKLIYLNPDDFEVTQYRIDYLGKMLSWKRQNTYRNPSPLKTVDYNQTYYWKREETWVGKGGRNITANSPSLFKYKRRNIDFEWRQV